MIRSKLLVYCAFAAILVLAAAPAWADSIPVANASFEAPTTFNAYSFGPYNFGPVTGWSTTGTAGVWQPNSSEFSSIPNGINVAFIQGTLSQVLTGNTVLPNTGYTLSVFVGDMLTGFEPGNYTISLDAGSTTLCTFSGNTTDITAGTFADETCNYQSGSTVPTGPLSIVLSGSTNSELVVDNVSVVTPEPGSLALLAAGLGFLFFVARRRKLQLPVTV